MSTLEPGTQLGQRYVLRERIATGGMSEVWRAEDTLLDRPVAVKVLAAELAGDPARRAAVHSEARATAKLNHPRITRMYDYGETTLPGGCRAAYLVMELVPGRTLAAKLAAGPLPWPEAVRMAGQVAAALAAAHRAGLVHRDIKPGNIMLTEGGAKVLDFGIAALIDGTAPGPAGVDEPTVEFPLVGAGCRTPAASGSRTRAPDPAFRAPSPALRRPLQRRPALRAGRPTAPTTPGPTAGSSPPSAPPPPAPGTH